MRVLSFTSVFLSLGIGICSAQTTYDSKGKNDISSCLLSSGIETISPELNLTAYEKSVTPMNLRTPWYPTAVATPSSNLQVSKAIKCAKRYSLKVAALSGGHSYAGYGFGGQNGSLVLNMRNFRDLKFDERTKVATVGAGMRLGNIALGLYANGKRDIPHGVCPGVGLGGHATHGGFGFTSRMWGTTLDAVVGMDVVLADGKRKYVDNKTDPDLFWALRGAGESFGVVTRFHVQTLLAPEAGTIFNFTFPTLQTAEERVAIFTAVQQFAITAPAKFHLRVFSVPDLRGLHPLAPEHVFVVSGVYWGSESTDLSLIEPLVSQFPNNTKHVHMVHDYLTALSSFDTYNPLKQEDYQTPPPSTFFTKSVISPDPLTPASLTSFFNFITSPNSTYAAPVVWYVIHDLYGGIHSKVGKYALDSASYAGRDTLWTMQLFSTPWTFAPPYPDEGFTFLQNMVDSIQKPQPQTSFSAYPNYVDPSLKREEALRLYYGPQLERLKRIKAKVDKWEVFWNPQSVSVNRRV